MIFLLKDGIGVITAAGQRTWMYYSLPISLVLLSGRRATQTRTWICDSVLIGILAARKTGRATYVDVL